MIMIIQYSLVQIERKQKIKFHLYHMVEVSTFNVIFKSNEFQNLNWVLKKKTQYHLLKRYMFKMFTNKNLL